MWTNTNATLQLSLFAEDFVRRSIDPQAAINEAHRLRAETFAQYGRNFGGWVADLFRSFFTAELPRTHVDTHAHTVEARRMQAEVVGQLVGGAVKRLMAPLTTAYRRWGLASELNRLDDRMLADIGIIRADIPAVARAAFASQSTTAGAVGGAVKRLAAFFATASKRRHMARELNRLSDHMLADIGLIRADIPAVTQAAFGTQPQEATAQASATVHQLPLGDGKVALATPANESKPSLAA